MPEDDNYDYLIVGSTPLAGLIAGLLATAHGKRVCLVAEPYSPFRLQHSIDLSVAPVTRPETLSLLKRVGGETGKLISAWGKGLVSRLDPVFVAETPESIAALGHFRHLAAALGYAIEPVADHTTATGLILRLRDAQMLAHGRFEPALEAWLDQHDVRRLDPSRTAVSIRKDGIARIATGELVVEARHAVFASDAAIHHYLPPEALDRSLESVPGSAILLEGGKPLLASSLNFLDRGVSLVQDGRVSITAIVTGASHTARARLGSATGKAGELRLAGEAQAPTIRSLDGAPYVGAARGVRATLVTGLGLSGAFLAPAVARLLAGASAGDEASWFAARGPTRGNLRQLVAEHSAVPA